MYIYSIYIYIYIFAEIVSKVCGEDWPWDDKPGLVNSIDFKIYNNYINRIFKGYTCSSCCL